MMRQRVKVLSSLVFLGFGSLMFFQIALPSSIHTEVIAQTQTPPTPASQEFDQKAALVKLREQIKGKEKEPAETVFKNIQMLKGIPAGRMLAIMEMGYSKSLGVSCSHCHVPDKWESEEKQTKQIARGMVDMQGKINENLLKGIKGISATALVNCTTCHRGQVIPATNMPVPAAQPATNPAVKN